MKIDNMNIFRNLCQFFTCFLGKDAPQKHPSEGPLLQLGLFGADQLEQHGRHLAASHKLTLKHSKEQLLTRLEENKHLLIGAYNQLTAAVEANHRITPASEWLLDNFYLVEKQINTIKNDLPRDYSRKLPHLLNGSLAGIPRVYDITLEGILYSNGWVDIDSFSRFVTAYQSVTALRLGELWAIPIMIRIALVENIRRIAVRIAEGRSDRELALFWTDQIIEVALNDPKNIILVVTDMARSKPPITAPFVSEFVRQLQVGNPALALPLNWMEQRLAESGTTIEQLVESANRQQASEQISISNSIGSLRLLDVMNWSEFVESISVVEHILHSDPNGSYGKMDFASRDCYRHVIERVAAKSPLSEVEVAKMAIRLADDSATLHGFYNRTAHVGFYLIDKGLSQLEQTAGVRFRISETPVRTLSRFPLPFYLGGITLITALLTGSLLAKAHANGVSSGLTLVLLAILLLLATSQLAISLVNWLATLLMSPHSLPKMDFSKDIPPEFRTLTVIPTMLTSSHNVEDLVRSLEVRFLTNQNKNLHFGLLSDFQDANKETLPDDGRLLRLAHEKINDLNEKYSSENNGTFFLFHRPRRWNSKEQVWMGYERKRGKLMDLNSFLRGGSSGAFSLIVGETSLLSNVKYVITLDTDTKLSRDSIWQFIGALAHPLNRAHYDECKRHITEGYGILQPRVSVSLPGKNQSRYAKLYSGICGIDPYTRVVSDIYQDVFGEGSFIGKGIYDIDAFDLLLNGRFPENLILSHDLLESCYVRTGLLSDVELYEEYPSSYGADMRRRHRWIRGDWQLVRWLSPYVPGLEHSRKNDLSGLSLWKIFDNLRRSLVPITLTILLLLGWLVLPSSWFWTLFVIIVTLIPSLITSLLEILSKLSDVMFNSHLSGIMHAAGQRLTKAIFEFVCLPHEAYFSLDAIVRTAWRMLITQKLLLEWNPSGGLEHQSHTKLAGSYRSMWIAPTTALATATILISFKPIVLLAAGPILLLWFLSPAIAWWISQPPTRRTRLSATQKLFLRKLSRKTWAFFETFVGPKDHWLPPDNYQEYRGASVAHRTSPTNMGLLLLSNLSAYDFGYIPAGLFIGRTDNTLNTMEALERYQGHFYNWYDTQSLKPLKPLYISSVDSGNLAAHLLTLSQGLLALPDKKIIETRWLDGIYDTLMILVDALGSNGPASLVKFQTDLQSALDSRPVTLAETKLCLERLMTHATEFAKSLDDALKNHSQKATEQLSDEKREHSETGAYMETDENSKHNSELDHASAVVSEISSESDVTWWARALVRQCHAILDELTFLAPYLWLPAAPSGLTNFPDVMEVPTLRELANPKILLRMIKQKFDASTTPKEHEWLDKFQQSILETSRHASERIIDIEQLALQSNELATRMEYSFLYDKKRRLLAIGYSVNDFRRDPSYYDLLASEARLCSFVVIAQGQVPQESWFSLGRLLTITGGESVLLSWSGSMFEYLMPLLVMPAYKDTLLDQTYKAVVNRQIDYGKQESLPWGISESCYNMVDSHLNYQYRGFGVPSLGLKRGLNADLVIAPYASALALMVAPEAACLNLQRLASEGVEGKFGFYEAIDYTPSRQRRGETSTLIKSYMAHHQGMILLSFSHLLLDSPMQKRFETNPIFQAAMQLLQERIPEVTTYYNTQHPELLLTHYATLETMETTMRTFKSPNTPIPQLQLLSNGRYHVMITNAGGGYSHWKDIALTRWYEDSTCDNWGAFAYIRDVESEEFWSNTYQPTLKHPKNYEAIFSEGRVEFRRHDNEFETHTEIVVSPEDDIEVRRIFITNLSKTRRTIEITSYAEVVLTSSAADAIHPAFSNLFVQTEIVDRQQAILCTRRPRSPDEQTPWMLHLMTINGVDIKEISYETDRLEFIGRGNTLNNPQTLTTAKKQKITNSAKLSSSKDSTLDPIVSISCQMTLNPGQMATANMIFGICETRGEALNIVNKYHNEHLVDQVFDLSHSHSKVVLDQINTTESEAQLYNQLASSIIYANSSLRADASVFINNRRGQSGLWGYAISGDLPIVLLQIRNLANIDLVRQLIQAHTYWKLKGLAVDLVIWNEDILGYRQLLQEKIIGLITTGVEVHMIDKPGGIFVRAAKQISNEDRILFKSVARAIIIDKWGTLAEQIKGRSPVEVLFSAFQPTKTIPAQLKATVELPHKNLIFFNGLGGFTPDGREYVITTTQGKITPAPWVNVLANPNFGTVISENGVACTWNENSHEFRLTPWGNDTVSDSRGEVFYLRDEESEHFWSPTPLPGLKTGSYISRHGFGYSVFEHTEDNIYSELWVYVAMDASIKFSVLKVRNDSKKPRKLSATGYVEWVLGDLRSKSAMHVITEIDSNSGALFASNSYSTEFSNRVAFFNVDDVSRTFSGDRTEFIGRNGTLENPKAMSKSGLSGKVGTALDPCGAIQVSFELAGGEEHEIRFALGAGQDTDDASKLVRRFRGSEVASNTLKDVHQYWNHTLGAVQVETPDSSLNVLTNGWLLYQTISCRLWARSGYYQSSGAFGFRDQLQDVMALVHTKPQLMREHLLLCASRQFKEGDVQHWWHPPLGRGVRTHCSDDYLWLPLATCRYVLGTGDVGVLDESVNFLKGRLVDPKDDSYYALPECSTETASLYEHCVRAIIHSLNFGEHGLPLIGSGDWNDSMNLVGAQGKGESVWLGFFLCEVLNQFSELACIHDDLPFSKQCQNEAAKLRRSIEQNAWDGKWYLRAYFDDGTPLGSVNSSECQIDSISQSWSVLSATGDTDRSRIAMDEVYERLVQSEDALIQLLNPPFEKSKLNPGYIKGYAPGIRENGGQYTHAAIWTAMAFAKLGNSKRAWELLEMINPINHGKTPEAEAIYKIEPYVVAGDVYALSPHIGHGGWSWYTGSAGWMYQLILESLLGLRLEAGKLHFIPCLNAQWSRFKIHYRYLETLYHITVTQAGTGNGEMSVLVDGVELHDKIIPLADDHREHIVEVRTQSA